MINLQLDMFDNSEIFTLLREIQKLREASEAQRKCLFGKLNELAKDVKMLKEIKEMRETR